MTDRPLRRDAIPTAGPSTLATLVGVVVALVLIAAVGVTIAKAVSTSSARVSATTSSGGLLSAGTIVVDLADDQPSLFLDADNLYPGRAVIGCVEVEYAGSVPAELRLHGDPGDGTGLDRFVDLRLDVVDRGECPTDASTVEDESVSEIFDGRLSDLWTEHATFATGIVLSPSVEPGDRIVLRATAEIVDDNRAAGRSTDFTLTIEGRPR